MARRRTVFRMLAIQRILMKYGLDDIIKETHLWRPLRFLFYLAPRRRDSSAPLGERIRLALEELGPIFVKFGQAISTRRDLLPPDIADELAKLQDAVPPFPAAEAIAIIEAAYGEPVGTVFERFDDDPLAAASIAQVHSAKLKSGAEVIVKVLRPGVHEQIERDLRVLHMLAGLAARYWVHGKRLKPREIVDEYEHTIIDELDLMREAANTAQLKRNFQDSDMLYVPDIYWDYCRPEVLVQERIYGTPISDMDALRAAGTNIQVLAENGVEIFFTQVFRHNFFHADMHPGNIFVDVTDPEEPRYIAVDCAIVGSLNQEDQDYLARNLLAFFNRDYAEVARLHLESGWVPDETDPDEFERVIREVCEPIFAKPLNQISFGQFLVELFETASTFHMEIQPQLVLLQKTLLYIEGLGRELYPELDLWETAKPFMESWMAERVGPAAALRELAERAPEILAELPRLPGMVVTASRQIRHLERVVDRQNRELHDLEARVGRLARGVRGRRMTGAALLVLASILLWGPIAESLNGGGDLGTVAGLASAAIASFLLLKA